MPSSDDIIDTENRARQLAIDAVVKNEGCSRGFATKYVNKLSKAEIAKLIGWPAPGQPYSNW